jgi:hypothetical protein
MAVVVPLVAAFASGAAAVGTIAAATTTLGLVAGYASLAGAVLTGVGAITGKKDLMKVGGILSLAGGIGSLANSAMNGASSAAAQEAAGKAADEAFKEAGDQALQEAMNNAAEGAAQDMAAATANDVAANGALAAAQDAATNTAGNTLAQTAGDTLTPLADGAGAAAGAATPVQEAVNRAGVTLADVGTSLDAGTSGINMAPLDSLQPVDLASSLTEGGTLSLMDKAKAGWGSLKDGFGTTSKFFKDNKELLSIGGQVLDGAFGAQAQQNKLLERKMAHEQSLLDRAYRNQNSVAQLYSPQLEATRAQLARQRNGG